MAIVALQLEERGEVADEATLTETGNEYFRHPREGWRGVPERLVGRGWLVEEGGVWRLTDDGRRFAEEARKERPAMRYWYEDYYAAAETSRALSLLCERVYGRDLSQHGMANELQIRKLLEITELNPESRVLDIGCGNGRMAEYISDTTGASVTGVDYISRAIRHARERTARKRGRLAFEVMDIRRLDFPPASFDTVLSVDTIYFSDDFDATIDGFARVTAPEGQMAIFYTRILWDGMEDQTETLHPDRTPLAEALTRKGLPYRTWDFSEADYRHGQRALEAAEDLRPLFEAEGNLFIYENRVVEANGAIRFHESGRLSRHLYHVRMR